MDEPQTSPETLRLSEVAELLGVASRKVQYLRERGIVIPTAHGQGRGNPTRYTAQDIQMVRVALAVPGLGEDGVKGLLSGFSDAGKTAGVLEYQLSPHATVQVDLSSVFADAN